MSDFALLHSRILDSSVWQLSKEARLVWITMLAMKDKDGVVQAAVVGLAARARVTLDECEEALRIFRNPDGHSSNPADDGRRIEDVPGGWRILNAEYYRFGTEAKREFWREQKAQQRERERLKSEKKSARRQRMTGWIAQPATNAVQIAAQKLRDNGDEAGAQRAEQIDAARVELDQKHLDEAAANSESGQPRSAMGHGE